MTLRRRAITGCLVLALVAAACGGDDDDSADDATTDAEGTAPAGDTAAPGTTAADDEGEEPEGEGGSITFWTSNVEPDRVAVQQRMIEAFTAETGISVDLVPVPEDDLANLMITNAASGDLPDVVQTALDYTIGWADQGILDVEAATEVVDSLGRDTFNPAALALVEQDGNPVAVPSDGWGNLVIYRTDLFEAAGLAPPDSYENILAAAEALHGDGVSGITMATDPADLFTQQTFEFFALANGCRLIEDDEVALDSEACVEALRTYADLVQNYSPGTVQTVDTTRATYFAGEAAMLIWSPFILDELAGLRSDTLPTCPECADDPLFLANNTGFVPAFVGPNATEPSGYGQISYWGIGTGGNTEGAKQFVEFLVGDGYLDWLGIAPEGEFPMRTGTPEEPNLFVDGWAELAFGVDTKVPFSEIYDEDVITTLIDGTEQFQRWGFAEGYGALVTSLYTSLSVPQAVSSVINEGVSPEDAASQMQSDASEQLEEVGGG